MEIKIIEKPVFEKRALNTNKGDFGHALMVTGSYGMVGAAILSGKACLRSGVGLLTATVCDKIYSPFTVAVPEAVCIPTKTVENGIDSSDKRITQKARKADCVLVGCGMGNTAETLKTVENLIINTEKALIIDADGINALAADINLLKKAKANVVLTPHPGEMARLCNVSVKEIQNNRIKYATEFAKANNCTVVLKGYETLVATAEKQVFLNKTGGPALATAGSGDVLAGLMLGLVSAGTDILTEVKNAVYIHGKLGDMAAEKYNERAVVASDLIEMLCFL